MCVMTYTTVLFFEFLRFEDCFHRGLLRQIIKPSYEGYFLWLELTLTFVIPA